MTHEDGFTLLELVVVMTIVLILSAVAVTLHTGARANASDAAAKANLAVSVPAVEAYYLDNGTYARMTLRRLQTTYSPGVQNITIVSARATTYCLRSTVNGRSWYKPGPQGTVTTTRCR